MAKKDKSQGEDKQLRAVPDRKAGVMKVRMEETPELTLETGESELEGEEQTQGILSSRAEILSETLNLEEGEAADDEGDEEDTPPAKDKVESNETLPEKFKGKSVEDVVTSYKELESLTSKLAQTNAELSKTLAEFKHSSQPDAKIEIPEDLAEKLLDDPKAAVSDLVKAITQQVTAQVAAKTKEYNEAQDIEATKKYLNENHAEYMSEDESRRLLDALAGVRQEETYIERYKGAIEDLNKLRGKAKESMKEEVKKEVEETEAMKVAATTIKGKPGTGSKKIWKQSDIDTMLLKNPALYAKMQSEITKAYLEKRVR